jgi:hypothetical protein
MDSVQILVNSNYAKSCLPLMSHFATSRNNQIQSHTHTHTQVKMKASKHKLIPNTLSVSGRRKKHLTPE